MRITVEPTEDRGVRTSVEAVQHRVVVEHPFDDIDLGGVIRLMASALMAYGFLSDQVAEYLREVQDP